MYYSTVVYEVQTLRELDPEVEVREHSGVIFPPGYVVGKSYKETMDPAALGVKAAANDKLKTRNIFQRMASSTEFKKKKNSQSEGRRTEGSAFPYRLAANLHASLHDADNKVTVL